MKHNRTATRKSALAPAIAVTCAFALLSGCVSVPSGGSSTQAAAPAAPNLTPDARGVITYASYQVAVVRSGDTIDTIAQRVGTTPAEIASANALPENYIPRAGEVLLLPASVPRPTTTATGFDNGQVGTETLDQWSPDAAAAAIEGANPQQTPFNNGQTEPLIDPVRHRVESGETAYSIARLYGVSVTALASWNGLGPDLMVRENQELLIPIVSDANRISGSTDTQPGETTAVAAPTAAAEPLPEDVTAAANPESPNLSQYRTPAGGKLSAPVSAGVTRAYDAGSPNGVGYSVPAGTSVKAAGDGTVALVSEEIGGMGTIVLIRHNDDLMTTYSTLSDVTVSKDDPVSAGQVIGKVADRDRPELQFDVFRGANSVDPTPYIQ